MEIWKVVWVVGLIISFKRVLIMHVFKRNENIWGFIILIPDIFITLILDVGNEFLHIFFGKDCILVDKEYS